MINSDLVPWNIYNNQTNPDLSINGNVIVNGLEWYNSYMPFFFEIKDALVVQKYLSQIQRPNIDQIFIKYFSPLNINKTIGKLKSRVYYYFNFVEKRLFSIEPDGTDQIEIMAFVLAALNLMQLYMDPVEALTTNKLSTISYPKFLPSPQKTLAILSRCPSPEIAYIPLAILNIGNKNEQIVIKAKKYYQNILNCTQDQIEESLTYSEKLYSYSLYMSRKQASKILELTTNKIVNLKKISKRYDFIYKMQEINGIMTWSKYVLTQSRPHRRRYDSTNNILSKIRNLPIVKENKNLASKIIPKTISGSEKQGLLIFILNQIKKTNKLLFSQIKNRANYYYNFSLNK